MMQTALAPLTLVGFNPDECLTSFCSRIALLVERPVNHFCLDMGFTIRQAMERHPDALAALAPFARLSPDGLAARFPIRLDKTRVVYRGHRLDRSTFQWSPLRVCPRCLLEDRQHDSGPPQVRAYRRVTWGILPIRTCQVHGCVLETWPTSDMPHYDFARHVAERTKSLPQMVRDTLVREPSSFERYLVTRLAGEAGEAGGGWLDGLSVHATARTCEMLGAAEAFGVGFTLDAMTDAHWHEAGAIGFEIVRHGEAAIRDCLSRWQKKFRTPKDVPPSPAALGRFYQWLGYIKPVEEFEPVRAIVRRHLIETTPVGQGDTILGEKVQERKTHSIHGAAYEASIDPGQLRQSLYAAGLIDEEALTQSDRQTVFDFVKAQPLLPGFGTEMPIGPASRHLNSSSRTLHDLVREGIVPASRRNGQWYFRKTDLDTFLERLLARAVDVAPHENLEPLQAAALHAMCPMVSIVELILAGKLARVGRLPDLKGFASVAVAADETRYRLRRSHPAGLSLEEAAEELATDVAAVRELIEAGYLAARNVGVLGFMNLRISEDEIYGFCSEFLTMNRAAKDRRMHYRRFMKAIENLAPAFNLPSGTPFYRRLDLTDLPALHQPHR